MVVPFLIGTFLVVLMFQINAYMFMAKTYNLENIPYSAVMQYILFRTPEFMKQTLPVGVSLGASLAITRLARESEVTAMRAAGIRLTRIVLPLALFGILTSIANYFLVENLIPDWTRRANAVLIQSGIMGLSRPTLKSNSIIELNQYTASFGTLEKMDDYRFRIKNIILYEHLGSKKVAVITAETAMYDRGIWTFNDGYYWEFEGENLLIGKPKAGFTVNQKIVVDSLFGAGQIQERSISELRAAIETSRKLGIDPKKEELELHSRFSVPVACFVFAITSPIFALIFARSGGFIGVMVSFVVVLLYFNAFVVSTEILVKTPFVTAPVAAWLPNSLFFILGLIALWRLE
jgi:lipopolysaccharide export system permease protein